MKKILLFSYYSEPDNNGATQRIKSFLNMLPEYDIEVFLVTKRLRRCNSDSRIIRFQEVSKSDTPVRWFIYRIWQRILGIRNRPYDYWKNKVLKKLPKLLEDIKPDYCMVSYPPLELIEIGLELEKLNQKVIIDFRDGFVFDPVEKYRFSDTDLYMRCIENEKGVVENAFFVTTSVVPLADYFKSKYKKTDIYVIENGFNTEELLLEKPLDLPSDKKVVLYTGALDKSRSGQFDIFKDFYSNTNLDVYFVFVGNYSREEIQFFEKCNNIIFYPKQNRNTVLATQKNADFLLLITGEDSSSATGGKLYEYLFSGVPIINIGNNNNAAKIISETKTGCSFSKDEFQTIEFFLNDTSQFQPTNLEKYTRRSQIEKFANIINTNF